MLTPERIKELSDRHLRVVGAGYVRPQDAEEFARAIESEVRRLHAENADRAARDPADSVTAPAATPTAASIAWTALRDLTDPLGEAGVKIMGHVRIYAQRQYEAGLAEGSADRARLEKAP